MELWVCPRCQEFYPPDIRPALSRVPQPDEPQEYVCPECGLMEAFEAYHGVLYDWRPDPVGTGE